MNFKITTWHVILLENGAIRLEQMNYEFWNKTVG